MDPKSRKRKIISESEKDKEIIFLRKQLQFYRVTTFFINEANKSNSEYINSIHHNILPLMCEEKNKTIKNVLKENYRRFIDFNNRIDLTYVNQFK